MIDAKFTIKNYRCFSDEKPLKFSLRNGFTAFVGPNNSGKSFILKFFYEFRHIWNIFLNPSDFNDLLRGTNKIVDFNGIMDAQEVFYRYHERNIEIEIEVDKIKLFFSIFKNNDSNILKKVKIYVNNHSLNNPNINIEQKKFNHAPLSNTSQTDASLLLELFNKLAKSIYIPSFRNAINVGGNNDYFDISIGENFINTWHNWQVGANNWQSQKIEDITNDIKELFEYESLQINASPQLKTLRLVINGKVHKLHEVGSGLSQFILVFASAALKQPSFILIDEPELNLHPSLQQKFLISLRTEFYLLLIL